MTWRARSQGDWRAGLKNGRGTHSFASGDQFEGEWENGRAAEMAPRCTRDAPEMAPGRAHSSA